MINRNMKVIASSVVAAVLSSSTVFAAGFEKSILWSGKYAGQGNAAVSSATGAEALYFNPAGLAGSKGTEVSLNVSPTFSKFSGPVATSSTSVDGKQTFSPVFGALASYAVNEKLGIGVGSYVSAGAKAEFENVSVTALGSTKTHSPKTDLSAIEYAVGVGYELIPGLKVGGSYRITQVRADLTLMSGLGSSATPIGSVSLTDMKATNSKGYRFGASYSGEGWGLGANYRGAVDFTLEGTSSGTVPTALGSFTGGSATAASTLPAQLSVGGFYDINSELKVNLEYVNTQYSKVNQINLTGAFSTGAGSGNLSATPVVMNWADQTNYRLGAVYTGLAGWTIRGGYVYTSQVTNSALARATLTPPGAAHSVTAGFTKGISESMDLSAAGEYTTAKGTATATGVPSATLAGDYAASGYMLHTGVSYRF